ncbi:MAG: hypothetical protein ACRDDY_07275 [Clostridium sp.]
MGMLVIPLIVLMLVSLILYTVSNVRSLKTMTVSKRNMAMVHISIVLAILGLFYMSGISSKLPYTNVSYGMMDVHQIVGAISIVAQVIAAITLSVAKRNNKIISSKIKVVNWIVWIIYIVCFVIAMYIGVLASM